MEKFSQFYDNLRAGGSSPSSATTFSKDSCLLMVGAKPSRHNLATQKGCFNMANIRKKGNKWSVQIRRTGHSSLPRIFHRKEEAIAWRRSQEVRFDAADAGVHLPVKQTLAELHDYVEQNLVQQLGGCQVPELQGDAGGYSYVFSRVSRQRCREEMCAKPPKNIQSSINSTFGNFSCRWYD